MPTPSIRPKQVGTLALKAQEPQSFGSEPLSRTLRIIAQDPSVKVATSDSKPAGILTTEVSLPCERLAEGPRGYRVYVVDYDSSTQTLYAPKAWPANDDPYCDAADSTLMSDPAFHAQNVYAIVMRTLAAFEFIIAIGDRHFSMMHRLKRFAHWTTALPQH